MRIKKKRVIASILAVSILLQPIQYRGFADTVKSGGSNSTSTSWLGRHWPFKSEDQQGKQRIDYNQKWRQMSFENGDLAKDLKTRLGISFEDAVMLMQYSKPAIALESTGFLGSIWGGVKSILFNMFFGYTSIIPSLLFMVIYRWASQHWNNFQARKELGETGRVVTPLEARLNFIRLAAGHKGQKEAKDKLLNIGVYLAYSVLKKNPIRKLVFEVGPPGTGKTTLVEILASVLACGFFNVGASDVDPGSKKSVIDQIFGPRTKRMNNSEYFEDSPVMKFLRATEGQPLRIIAINEFDKLSAKDKKLLLEFLRNAYDTGYAYINGEKINLENIVWVLTSNDADETVFESPSLMSRFEVVKFDKLTLQNYTDILQVPFKMLGDEFARGHNVHINFGDTVVDIAQKLTEGNTGARGVQAYVNTLTSKILNYIYSSENVNRLVEGKRIGINVSYDKDNDDFIIIGEEIGSTDCESESLAENFSDSKNSEDKKQQISTVPEIAATKAEESVQKTA